MKKTVFIHGLFGHVLDFEKIQNPEDIVIDLIDHDSEELTFASLTSSIKSYIDSITNEPCNIVGYSMGGRIAMELKVQYPEKFHRCAIIGSKLSLELEEIPKRILWQMNMELSLAFMSLSDFFKIWYSQELFHSFDWNLFSIRRLTINKFFHQKCLNQLNLFSQPNYLDLLIPFQKDLLFLYGDRDFIYKKYYQRISKKGYIIEEIKNSSHPTFLEQPESTKQSIKHFFDYVI